MFIRFDMIHERDGRTDRHVDTAYDGTRPRLCIVSCGKNCLEPLMNYYSKQSWVGTFWHTRTCSHFFPGLMSSYQIV